MEKMFTIVIPSFNRENYIVKAIRSVLQQTIKEWNLLIVDDNSTDNTIEKITPYLSDSRIQLVKLPGNKGISHVLNIALGRVETPFFIQLDSDDWLARNTLDRFQRAIQEHPNAALYYGNVALCIEDEQGKRIKTRIIKHRNFKNKYDFLTYLTYMLHPRCYRTDSVRSVGGWETNDEFHGRVMEDRRMCVKLIEKYDLKWIDRVLYYRRKHQNQLTNRKMYHARNKLRRELVQKYLKRWGSKYSAEFGYRNGLLIIKRLKPK